jgi:6-phosphogluconolactonase (cycloisomerase 2 family)
MVERQVLSALPDSVEASGSSTAELEVHPSGHFVYAFNYGTSISLSRCGLVGVVVRQVRKTVGKVHAHPRDCGS